MDTLSLKATVFYVVNGLTYTFPFSYIKKKFVCIKFIDKIEADYIDEGDVLLYGIDYIVNDNTIILKKYNNNKKYICIYRSTPLEMLNIFNDGSILQATNINISNKQLVHLCEELLDYSILHKLPKGLIQTIENLVEEMKANVTASQSTLNEVLKVYELIKEEVKKALIYTQSINVKSFNNTKNLIDSKNVEEGDLVRTKGYEKILDNKGALYTIEKMKGNHTKYLKLSNGLYAIKMQDEVDTDNILYKNMDISSVFNSYINFYYIDDILVIPKGNFIINDNVYIKNTILDTEVSRGILFVNIKKEA